MILLIAMMTVIMLILVMLCGTQNSILRESQRQAISSSFQGVDLDEVVGRCPPYRLVGTGGGGGGGLHPPPPNNLLLFVS